MVRRGGEVEVRSKSFAVSRESCEDLMTATGVLSCGREGMVVMSDGGRRVEDPAFRDASWGPQHVGSSLPHWDAHRSIGMTRPAPGGVGSIE